MGRLKLWLVGWLGIDARFARIALTSEADTVRWNVDLTRYANRLEELKEVRRENAELIQRVQVLSDRLLILERRAQDAPPPRAQAINRLRSLSEAQGGFKDVGISAVHGA